MADLHIGIDMGGTSVKVGLVTETGQMQAKTAIKTGEMLTDQSCTTLAQQVAEFVASQAADSRVASIGVAIPGVVNPHAPVMLPNVKLDLDLLLECLRQAFPGAHVTSVNDADAAGLGEQWLGTGRDAQSMLFVTIGTGIGGALIEEGRLVVGFNGAAGEIGHLRVVENGRPCGCGRNGCLERYASASGIVESYRQACSSLTGQDADANEHGYPVPQHDTDSLAVFRAFEQGSPAAAQAMHIFTDALGLALSQITCVFDPQVILLGGGVAAGAPLFLDALSAAYRQHCIPPCGQTPILVATLGNDAGMLGAARFAMTDA